MESNTKRQQ